MERERRGEGKMERKTKEGERERKTEGEKREESEGEEKDGEEKGEKGRLQLSLADPPLQPPGAVSLREDCAGRCPVAGGLDGE